MIMGIWAGIPSPYNIVELVWYDVPLGGPDNTFGFFPGVSDNEIALPGVIENATRMRVSGTVSNDYTVPVDLRITGYVLNEDGMLGNEVVDLKQYFDPGTRSFEFIIDLSEVTKTYPAYPGLESWFDENSRIGHFSIHGDMLYTRLAIPDLKIQVDVPITLQNPEPETTWYDVPLGGGAGNAFVDEQFGYISFDLPGSITGATKVRLVGTWEGTYWNGDLFIRGYAGDDEGSHVLGMRYRKEFGAENWSDTIDAVMPIQPGSGEVDGEPGLSGFFRNDSNIVRIEIFDGVGTGITGINIKLQIDVPFNAAPVPEPEPEPEFTWYDVPLGGADNAFIDGQFNNELIFLPGTITGATKVRLVGTWQGIYSGGDLTVRGYTGGFGGSCDLTMAYQESFGTEEWSGAFDLVIPIQPDFGSVDGQPGLEGFFYGGANINCIEIFDGVGTGITGINIKLQTDVPLTVEGDDDGSGTNTNLWSSDNFDVRAYPHNGSSFSVTSGSGNDSWLTSTTSRHLSSATARPRSLNVNFTNKQPSFIDVQIANFQKLSGYESDNTAVGHFIAAGIDNVTMARATITGDGTYRMAVDWSTWSNTDILFFYIDTTGRETYNSGVIGWGDYVEKVKFDVVSLVVDDVLPGLTIWHESNWTSGHDPDYGSWGAETVYEVYNFGAGGRWDVIGTWAQGLRPVSIIIYIDRYGNTDEIEIRVHDAEERVIGQGYSYGSGTVEIVIGPDSPYDFPEQINDILYITTFCNFGVPESYAIKSMVFTY